MSLFNAFSTFFSCNKPGSISQFTEYLSKNPNDHTALLWRGRAFKIMGQSKNALADFRKARSVSSDPRRSIADALSEKVNNNFPRYIEILEHTTNAYETCGEALAELGNGYLLYDPPKISESEKALTAAIRMAERNSETGEPWYYGVNYNMARICISKGNIDEALQYFRNATEACHSLTIAHMGMCYCYLKRGDRRSAQICLETANKLNKSIVPWTSLKEYEKEPPTIRTQLFSLPGNNDENIWKEIQQDSPCIAEYNKKIYVQSKDGDYWYTRDKAGHGGQGQGLSGSFVKVYKNLGSTLEFIGSKDIKMDWIEGKHESKKVPSIQKSDLNIRRGAIKKK